VQIFISWSGERSKALARALKDWLPNVIQASKPWLSEDLPKGTRWSQVVGEKLASSGVGILCVTPENVDAPWLQFEAGALSNKFDDARVCPLLLDMAPEQLDGPLTQFQLTTTSEMDVRRLVADLNDLLGPTRLSDMVLQKAFGRYWPDLETEVQKASAIPIGSAGLQNVVRALRKGGLPEPELGRTVSFKAGFESHLLYATAFSLAKQRILIFGRKNRKVFDKEHEDFFRTLAERRANGLDFRCLFLDPTAPNELVAEAHGDKDFPSQLKRAIVAAADMLTRHNMPPSEVCRMYRFHRATAIVVIDDIVLFSPIAFDEHGRARGLTKSPFKIVSAADSLGSELLGNFEAAWRGAGAFTA